MNYLTRLTQARKAAKITQTQAGQHLGIATSTVSDFERGDTPLSMERFQVLCKLYGASPIEILTGIKPNFDAEEVRQKAVNMRTEATQILALMSE